MGDLVAGLPGIETGTSGSEGPKIISDDSSRRHSLETLFTGSYLYIGIMADNLETSSTQERLIEPIHLVCKWG